MALTNRGEKWERKNSLYLIFAFLPVFNSVTFFYINSRVKNKKRNAIAWVLILLQLALVVGLFIVSVISDPALPNYYTVEDFVYEVDY